jgi:hypothetical protein
MRACMPTLQKVINIEYDINQHDTTTTMTTTVITPTSPARRSTYINNFVYHQFLYLHIRSISRFYFFKLQEK